MVAAPAEVLEEALACLDVAHDLTRRAKRSKQAHAVTMLEHADVARQRSRFLARLYHGQKFRGL